MTKVPVAIPVVLQSRLRIGSKR